MVSYLSSIEILVTTEYCQVAILALLTYDWLLCLPSEITHVWAAERRKTVATILYVINRYVMIIALVLPVTTFFPLLFPTWSSCAIETAFATATTLAPVMTYPVFDALRVYALSGRNKALSALTFALAFTSSIILLVSQAAYTRIVIDSPPYGCTGYDTTRNGLGVRLVFVQRALDLVGNGLIIFVTWRNTQWATLQQPGLTIRPSFSSVMLYHGSAYFLALIVMIIAQILFSVFKLRSIYTSSGYSEIFVKPLECVLISRFLLGLQETAADLALTGTTRSSLDLNFASTGGTSAPLPHFIASMGNSVHSGDFREETSSMDQEDVDIEFSTLVGDESDHDDARSSC